MRAGQDATYYRERAEREIALATATGAKAHASSDCRVVYIQTALSVLFNQNTSRGSGAFAR
jgi:hypothetical protein